MKGEEESKAEEELKKGSRIGLHMNFRMQARAACGSECESVLVAEVANAANVAHRECGCARVEVEVEVGEEKRCAHLTRLPRRSNP
jgi:hypothetical protein